MTSRLRLQEMVSGRRICILDENPYSGSGMNDGASTSEACAAGCSSGDSRSVETSWSGAGVTSGEGEGRVT